MPHEAEVGLDEDPARLQRAPAAPERVLADRVEDDVVRLAVLREVLLRVVDDLVGAERAHELDVLRVAHRRDVRRPSALASCTAAVPIDAGGAVDEDAPPLAEGPPSPGTRSAMLAPSQTAAASSKVMPAGLCASAPLSRTQTYSAFAPSASAEDLVADLELGDGRADCLDHAGELHPEDPLLRSAEAGEDAGEERVRPRGSRSPTG